MEGFCPKSVNEEVLVIAASCVAAEHAFILQNKMRVISHVVRFLSCSYISSFTSSFHLEQDG